jgi:hypothetical protein
MRLILWLLISTQVESEEFQHVQEAALKTPSSIEIDGLTVGQKIGEGGFADVFEGTYRGKAAAIKLMSHHDKEQLEVRLY